MRLSSPTPRSWKHYMRPAAYLSLKNWDRLGTVLVNLFVLLLLIAYLFPMAYMLVTAFKDDSQFNDANAPWWPGTLRVYSYQGKDIPIYQVPFPQGTRLLALVTPYRAYSEFIDPNHPEAGLIRWDGYWRSLSRKYDLTITLKKLPDMMKTMEYPLLVRNSLTITILSEIGVLLSSILVAYGFSRYPVPKGDFLFGIMLASIMLPEKATLIPTYYLFNRIFGWGGTYYPLVLPYYFGSAVLIFLLRQNFKSIPKEVDEAAMLDGAKPLRILFSIILPQSVPVLVTAGLLHFFYSWSEIRLASLYLSSAPQLYPVSFGVQQYQRYFPPPNQLQLSALLAMAIPVLVLFASQRIFMQHVVVTGMEK